MFNFVDYVLEHSTIPSVREKSHEDDMEYNVKLYCRIIVTFFVWVKLYKSYIL